MYNRSHDSPHVPLLAIQEITKTYRTGNKTHEALRTISLTINQGTIISLLGINGAGKTTLSNIVATLIPPTSGAIYFKGTSIYNDVPEYRMHVGFCPQHPNLNTQLTLQENLVYAGMAYRLSATQAQTRANELMKNFGLIKYAEQKAGILSGGYKQRFMLARSVMHKPELIILDEPTVGLDPHVRHQLWDYLKQLREQGTSILLTTHYIEEAEVLSDLVCVLHNGTIKYSDTPESLKTAFNKKTLESVFIELTKEQEAEAV